MKIAFAVVALVVAGCASPQNAVNDPSGAQPDLAGDGTGGNGTGADMALPGGGGNGGGGGGGGGGAGGGGGGGATQDMATPVDMAKPAADLAQAMCLLNVPASTCGIWPQCGCAGAAPNCNVEDNTTGKASCAATGNIADWNGCTGNGDGQCGVGRSCVDGVCSPFCGQNSDCTGSYRECVQVQANGAKITGFKVCTSFCDPTSPQSSAGGHTACGPNINCYPNGDHDSYCTGPTAAAGLQGADCTTSNAADPTKCAPGFACVTVSVFGTNIYQCQQFCNVGAANACPSGYTCGSFSTKQYAGTQEIGGCS